MLEIHADIELGDLGAMVARLVALAGMLDRPIQNCEYERMVNMADAFGNGFNLIEFFQPGL